jgi:hypothetical protein
MTTIAGVVAIACGDRLLPPDVSRFFVSPAFAAHSGRTTT